MLSVIMVGVMTLGAGLPEDAVIVRARVDAPSWKVGVEYDIVLEVAYAEALSPSGVAISSPILQIEVPPSALLSGEVLKSQKALSKNEYLQAPYERLLRENPARVKFKLQSVPEAGERFSLNVLVYVGVDGGEAQHFVRRRLLLPLSPGAKSEPAPSSPSDWGQSETLQLGASAPSFTLPTGPESTVSLESFRGRKNVVVTTYRAYW